jgi:hypothetical protein
MSTQGIQIFRCVVEDISWPVKYTRASLGGALQIYKRLVALEEARERI